MLAPNDIVIIAILIVVRIRVADVDEMILNRFETEGSKEDGLWPREFWLER